MYCLRTSCMSLRCTMAGIGPHRQSDTITAVKLVNNPYTRSQDALSIFPGDTPVSLTPQCPAQHQSAGRVVLRNCNFGPSDQHPFMSPPFPSVPVWSLGTGLEYVHTVTEPWGGPRLGAAWEAGAPLLSLIPRGPLCYRAGTGVTWGGGRVQRWGRCAASAFSTSLLISVSIYVRAGVPHPEHYAPVKAFSRVHCCSKILPGDEDSNPFSSTLLFTEWKLFLVLSSWAFQTFPPGHWQRQSSVHTGHFPKGSSAGGPPRPHFQSFLYYFLFPSGSQTGSGFLSWALPSCSTPALPKASHLGLPRNFPFKLVSVLPPPHSCCLGDLLPLPATGFTPASGNVFLPIWHLSFSFLLGQCQSMEHSLTAFFLYLFVFGLQCFSFIKGSFHESAVENTFDFSLFIEKSFS